MKTCTKCNLSKELEFFHKSSRHTCGYHSQCKDCINKKNKNYRVNNYEKYLTNRQRHYSQNIEKFREQKVKSAKKYKDKKRKYDIQYRLNHKITITQYKKKWEEKNKNNPVYKIKKNLRRRVHHALNGLNKSDNTFKLIGCSPEQFKTYIESLFESGMSWDNYGLDGWHIDHIIPCYKFDLTKEEEQRKCFHYSNQRPLWAKDNLSRPRD